MTSYNPFAALMMAQQAGLVATPEQEAESAAVAERLGIPLDMPVDDYPQGITVNGGRMPVQQAPAPDMYSSAYNLPEGSPELGNTEWVKARNEANEETEKASGRKGMFGMKGTLRDVLGLLGDSFLVQAGRDRVYEPQRQREKISDAMAGYTQSPLGAAERVAGYDPKLGNDIANDYADNQARAQQAASLQASREDMAATRSQARFDKARAYTAALLNAAGDDPERVTYALQQAERAARAANTTLADLGITENMTPAQRATYAQAGMNTYQQEGLERRDRQLDTTERQGDERIAIARQNAETARRRMEKSGGSRGGRPRADTELEYFRALESIPASQRSSEENAWVQKYTGQNTGRGAGRRPVAAPARSGNGPRILRVRDK